MASTALRHLPPRAPPPAWFLMKKASITARLRLRALSCLPISPRVLSPPHSSPTAGPTPRALQRGSASARPLAKVQNPIGSRVCQSRRAGRTEDLQAPAMGASLRRKSRELGQALTGSFSQTCSAARGAAWVNTVCMSSCLMLQGGAEGRELRRGPAKPDYNLHLGQGTGHVGCVPGTPSLGECAGAPGPALPRGGRAVRGCGSGTGALSAAVGTGVVGPGSPSQRPCLPAAGSQPQGCSWRHRWASVH